MEHLCCVIAGGFEFANLNIDFTAQEGAVGVELSGPAYAHPFFQRPKKDKDVFANALAGALKEIAGTLLQNLQPYLSQSV